MDDMFFRDVLNSLKEQLAIIDGYGVITFVNESWIRFFVENGGDIEHQWIGHSYFSSCEVTYDCDDSSAIAAMTGIKSVLQGENSFFTFEYPCHSPDDLRWFILRIEPVNNNHRTVFVITHQDITLRKLAELTVEQISLHDPLTSLSNRRHFDSFFANEWRICQRNSSCLCIMMLDLDNFKHYNDKYGHPSGDDCLQKVAIIIQQYAARASDLCTRFGGDEFALLLGDSSIEYATTVAHKIIAAVANLKLQLPDGKKVGINIGLTGCMPGQLSGNDKTECIARADRALYEAKQNGRNRLEIL